MTQPLPAPVVPPEGFAPSSHGLRVRYSAVRLRRQSAGMTGIEPARRRFWRPTGFLSLIPKMETFTGSGRCRHGLILASGATPRYRAEPYGFSGRRFHLVSLSGKRELGKLPCIIQLFGYHAASCTEPCGYQSRQSITRVVAVVREQGLEPQLTDPESAVLPLDDSRMWCPRRDSNPQRTE